MTTDIERQFFDTFGIESKYRDYRVKNGKEYESKNPNNRNIRLCYPQITDRILLELICILSEHYSWGEENWFLSCDSIDYLKQFILSRLIELQEDTWFCSKQQVQALFEEG